MVEDLYLLEGSLRLRSQRGQLLNPRDRRSSLREKKISGTVRTAPGEPRRCPNHGV